ncbi:MAG: TetR/AcrR family transcriptional regulator [Solirubrobacterales bacterium]
MSGAAAKGPDGRGASRKKIPRAEREALMIESATLIFAERGFRAANMDQIAEGAGVTKRMLYAYFDSKEALLAACIERAAAPLTEEFERAIDRDLPADQQLWQGILAYFGWFEDQREWGTRIHFEAAWTAGRPREAVERIRGRVVALVAGMITEQAEKTLPKVQVELVATQAEPIARAFVGAAEELTLWWLEHPEQPRELVAMRLMNFAWQGFNQLSKAEFWLPPSGHLGWLREEGEGGDD